MKWPCFAEKARFDEKSVIIDSGLHYTGPVGPNIPVLALLYWALALYYWVLALPPWVHPIPALALRPVRHHLPGTAVRRVGLAHGALNRAIHVVYSGPAGPYRPATRPINR